MTATRGGGSRVGQREGVSLVLLLNFYLQFLLILFVALWFYKPLLALLVLSVPLLVKEVVYKPQGIIQRFYDLALELVCGLLVALFQLQLVLHVLDVQDFRELWHAWKAGQKKKRVVSCGRGVWD